MEAIVAGERAGTVGAACDDAGVNVEIVDDRPTGETLERAGIDEATVLVLTDVSDATAVPVALERNPDLLTVIYDEIAAPSFVRGQLDLAVDPRLVTPPDLVAAIRDRAGDH